MILVAYFSDKNREYSLRGARDYAHGKILKNKSKFVLKLPAQSGALRTEGPCR